MNVGAIRTKIAKLKTELQNAEQKSLNALNHARDLSKMIETFEEKFERKVKEMNKK